MSDNIGKREKRKLCPLGWIHCAEEVCEWWLESEKSCAVPFVANILAESARNQNIWGPYNDI